MYKLGYLDQLAAQRGHGMGSCRREHSSCSCVTVYRNTSYLSDDAEWFVMYAI